MSKINIALTFLFSLLIFNTNNAFAEDFESPEAAVNTYITAVTNGSGKHIELAFSESASIQYYDAEGALNNYSRDAFAKLVNTGNQWNAKIEITHLKKTKYAANATVEFTWGEKGKHGYVDYLNLLFDGNSWHITDKVAQYIER